MAAGAGAPVGRGARGGSCLGELVAPAPAGRPWPQRFAESRPAAEAVVGRPWLRHPAGRDCGDGSSAVQQPWVVMVTADQAGW